MQRLSGIATLTRKFVDAVAGTKARILDTRKTMPGLRMLDKYAVRCGGGQNHRLDLSDGVLCDNTLRADGADGRPVVAIGDGARFPNPLFGPVPARIEHWSVPGETAGQAVRPSSVPI